MYAHVVSLGVTGLDGYPVTVETHISGGLPKFAMVGLPDSAVKESSWGAVCHPAQAHPKMPGAALAAGCTAAPPKCR